ncbi:hypothetical protein RRG08_008847 [Elysia crispata]|uniref:Uncharacterized protein n=1 Tax=Elysia crispata TaxID=231223 RepID=A0AAE1DV56_9GAST|nr:hypothetical protein RRG08_008847 [Elysia crispata]
MANQQGPFVHYLSTCAWAVERGQSLEQSCASICAALTEGYGKQLLHGIGLGIPEHNREKKIAYVTERQLDASLENGEVAPE